MRFSLNTNTCTLKLSPQNRLFTAMTQSFGSRIDTKQSLQYGIQFPPCHPLFDLRGIRKVEIRHTNFQISSKKVPSTIVRSKTSTFGLFEVTFLLKDWKLVCLISTFRVPRRSKSGWRKQDFVLQYTIKTHLSGFPIPNLFKANMNYIPPSRPSSMKQCTKSATVKFHMELSLTKYPEVISQWCGCRKYSS